MGGNSPLKRSNSVRRRVENLKKLAEAVWVVKHAKQCKCGEEERTENCCVNGCITAKRVLRIIEEEDRQGILNQDVFPEELKKAKHFVRGVLDHNCNTEKCLLCALVCRARASVVIAPMKEYGKIPSWHVRLDFSQNCAEEGPNFNVPLPQQLTHCLLPPDLRRSTTTEELALVLSDLSGGDRGHISNGQTKIERRRRPDLPFGDDQKSSKKKRSIQDTTRIKNYNLKHPNKKRRSVRPPSRYRDDSSENEDECLSPRDTQNNIDLQQDYVPFDDLQPLEPPNLSMLPPSSQPRALYYGKNQNNTRTSRIAPCQNTTFSNQFSFGPPLAKPLLPSVIAHTKSADLCQRSPSFSAAASSLLALTGGHTGHHKQREFSPAPNPLLVPHC